MRLDRDEFQDDHSSGSSGGEFEELLPSDFVMMDQGNGDSGDDQSNSSDDPG